MEVTERICELMSADNVSRSELADRLGVKSRGYVTQILGGKNLTLRTVSDIYLALNRQFHPSDSPLVQEHDEYIGPAVLRFSLESGLVDKSWEMGAEEPEWQVGGV
jgi:transcriptional regulator with XRE-family HTH domain